MLTNYFKNLSFWLIILSCFLYIKKAQALAYQIQIPLPDAAAGTSFSDPAAYIRHFFIFGLSLLAFLTVAVITTGGIMYITAGSLTSVDRAKEMIKSAVFGLFLLLGSYLLVFTLDPAVTNLSAATLQKFKIERIADAYDLPNEAIKNKNLEQVEEMIKDGKITGNGLDSCPIAKCGSTYVDDKQLSSGAAKNYLSLQEEINQACKSQGLECSTKLSSTTDGQHASRCHQAGDDKKGGTCGDFVITAPECNGSIKNCSAEQREKYIQVAASVLSKSSKVSSCLNEYKVKGSSFTTGGHFHCNF